MLPCLPLSLLSPPSLVFVIIRLVAHRRHHSSCLPSSSSWDLAVISRCRQDSDTGSSFLPQQHDQVEGDALDRPRWVSSLSVVMAVVSRPLRYEFTAWWVVDAAVSPPQHPAPRFQARCSVRRHEHHRDGRSKGPCCGARPVSLLFLSTHLFRKPPGRLPILTCILRR
jgi:hypothetical protein